MQKGSFSSNRGVHRWVNFRGYCCSPHTPVDGIADTELGIEAWIGNAAEIKAKRVRKQKTDRHDAQTLAHVAAGNSVSTVRGSDLRDREPAGTDQGDEVSTDARERAKHGV